MAERLALAADARGDLRVVAVRPHLVWGPGDTQLVARIARRARAAASPDAAGRVAFRPAIRKNGLTAACSKPL